MGSAIPEPLGPRLQRLREARRENGRPWSRSTLSRNTVGYNGKGIAEVTVKAVEAGDRQPSLETIEAYVYALNAHPEAEKVDPEEWPEFRLAIARASLDERDENKGGVGLENALSNLARLEAAGLSIKEMRAKRQAEKETMRFAAEDLQRQRKKRKKAGD